MTASRLAERQDLMDAIVTRLHDMGFVIDPHRFDSIYKLSAADLDRMFRRGANENAPASFPSVPVYEKRRAGRRVALARVEFAADGFPEEGSLVTIEAYQDGIYARLREEPAGEFVKGLGPRPVTALVRKTIELVREFANV